MTVKELMEFLEKCPDDLRVVVNGYEDGYEGECSREYTKNGEADPSQTRLST